MLEFAWLFERVRGIGKVAKKEICFLKWPSDKQEFNSFFVIRVSRIIGGLRSSDSHLLITIRSALIFNNGCYDGDAGGERIFLIFAVSMENFK